MKLLRVVLLRDGRLRNPSGRKALRSDYRRFGGWQVAAAFGVDPPATLLTIDIRPGDEIMQICRTPFRVSQLGCYDLATDTVYLACGAGGHVLAHELGHREVARLGLRWVDPTTEEVLVAALHEWWMRDNPEPDPRLAKLTECG